MINANQIAILVIAHFPGGIMIDLMILRQYDGLGKVYKPNTRLLVIMHEQQRTANSFVPAKELRTFEGGVYGAQALHIARLLLKNID